MAQDDIIVTWQVNDGYVGGDRLQYTRIDREEYELCETEEERENLIDAYVQTEFEQLGFCIEDVSE